MRSMIRRRYSGVLIGIGFEKYCRKRHPGLLSGGVVQKYYPEETRRRFIQDYCSGKQSGILSGRGIQEYYPEASNGISRSAAGTIKSYIPIQRRHLDAASTTEASTRSQR